MPTGIYKRTKKYKKTIRLNLVGQKFEKLKVINFLYIKNRNSCWECLCDCGNKTIVFGNNLKRGITKSCGCLKKEGRNKRHGMSKTRFHRIWCGIKERCLNIGSRNYKKYGRRGITICKEWLKFKNFRDDMYKNYLEHCKEFGEKDTTIDRENNNGNYELNNCRWATQKVQQNNRNKRRIQIKK